MVIVNGITAEQALGACQMTGTVPLSTLYSRVKAARDRGSYNDHIRRADTRRIGAFIDITEDEETMGVVSPVTMDTTLLSLTSSQPAAPPRKKTRRSSKQASIARLDAKRSRVDYEGRFKAAFKDATNLVSAKARAESVQSICSRLNIAYGLDGKRRLTRSTLYQATKDGLAGTSPKKKGPASKIPDTLLAVVATHAEVCQVESVWRKVRSEYPDALQAANKISVEDARAQWTTHDNLNQWFDDAKKDLVATGLVEDRAVHDENGKVVSEVYFKCDSQRRIINMDETHHNLAITGDRGGPRAVSYHNPAFQRGASRGVKSGRHVTGVYATNAEGEALPLFYIFDSTAKSEENFRVKMDWLVGLPTIEGRFGCPSKEKYDSFYAVRSRGSMDDELLNQYIETVILPLYPNMNKTAIFDEGGRLLQGPVILKVDAGPGRIVSSQVVLAKREALFEKGLIILLGLPNATSVQQEMDALYGPFKSATYSRGEKVVQQKLKERGLARRNGQQLSSAVLNLNFEDLPIIVNGTATDVVADKPFDLHFTRDKILWSWAKVGFVALQEACRYNFLVDDLEGDGFNPGIFDAVIPTAAHVHRAATENAQIEELLKSGKAFSASGQWNFCDSRIGNAGVTLRAQKLQLQLNETARTNTANKKNEAQLKTLDRAQAALTKYEADTGSLTEKEWGEIVRWVLPAASVPYLLKDLKKRDQILAKLETFPNAWTTYIPRREVAVIIPPTTV
ncbi:hypothetical protein MHU86_3461 [Fragilaria crotonensis]|nr:hypothetical protein MHU86_3461 [Fragilaria crotonensis]